MVWVFFPSFLQLEKPQFGVCSCISLTDNKKPHSFNSTGFLFLPRAFFLFPNCDIHLGGIRDGKYSFAYLKVWTKFDLPLAPLLPQLPLPSCATETVFMWEANLNIPADIPANRHKNIPHRSAWRGLSLPPTLF